MIVQPRVGRLGADIIIDESGQTWVKDISFAGVWLYPYVKIEEIRAKNYRPGGSTRDHSRKRPGTRGGRPSNGYAGSGYRFDESSDNVRDDYTRLTQESHAMVMDWMREHIRLEDHYTIRKGVV